MTFDHKEASEKLHELYGCGIYTEYINERDGEFITQDIGELMKLAIENDVQVLYGGSGKEEAVYCQDPMETYICIERYYDHNNDKVEATCAAITQALIKLKE